jgi:hypothetical protein
VELLIGLLIVVAASFLTRLTTKQRLGIAILVAAVAVGLWWIRQPGPEVAFTYPLEAGEVGTPERVRFESSHVSQSALLWLAVYSHDVDRFYPQAFAPERDDDDWTLTTHIGVEGDVGKIFDLVVFRVSSRAMPDLTDYIETGRVTGSWDGLRSLPDGFDELDRITVKRLGISASPPPLRTDEDNALAAVTGFLDSWIAADYDVMCTYLEPCAAGWPDQMRAFPVPVRDYELGELVRTEDGFRIPYEIQLPDHGSLVGAFMETSETDRWATVLGVTGSYVTWADTLDVREFEGSYRMISALGEAAEGSARISSFLWSLGLAQRIGIPGDSSRERFAIYWATFGVEFGVEMHEIELLIEQGVDQHAAYLERIDNFGYDVTDAASTDGAVVDVVVTEAPGYEVTDADREYLSMSVEAFAVGVDMDETAVLDVIADDMSGFAAGDYTQLALDAAAVWAEIVADLEATDPDHRGFIEMRRLSILEAKSKAQAWTTLATNTSAEGVDEASESIKAAVDFGARLREILEEVKESLEEEP